MCKSPLSYVLKGSTTVCRVMNLKRHLVSNLISAEAFHFFCCRSEDGCLFLGSSPCTLSDFLSIPSMTKSWFMESLYSSVFRWHTAGQNIKEVRWRVAPEMNGGHKTRTKSVWETRFIQILRLPSWLKNSFKDGASKEKKFKNARNQK